jgi:hypothetical protein
MSVVVVAALACASDWIDWSIGRAGRPEAPAWPDAENLAGDDLVLLGTATESPTAGAIVQAHDSPTGG